MAQATTNSDAQRTASKAAVAEYVKDKTIRDLVKAPVVRYTYSVDGLTFEAKTRVDVLRYVESAETKRAIRDKAQYISQQVVFVQQELSKNITDKPKVHRKVMLSAIKDIAVLLGLDDVNFGPKDAAFIVAFCTHAKRKQGTATTDISVSESAWRAVSALLTNKLNRYDAKLMMGKTEYNTLELTTYDSETPVNNQTPIA